VTEILNVAVLNGVNQEYALRIYAVDDIDRLTDVTRNTKCHSVEVDVLKVSSDCSSVYVDGAENRGSHNVTIIAKYGQTTAFLDVAVWVPEERLDLQLSDTKLSRISITKRASDPFLKHPAYYYDKMAKSEPAKGRNCELLRQQALLEVYTRFYIQTPKQTEYFMGQGTYLKVTDLVKNRFRMSDNGVATLTSDNIIIGKEEGRTEIQLQSPRNGNVMAAREIQVSHDKVTIRQLNLRLVTGMTMFVEPSRSVPGALVATAHIDSNFLSEHHMGIIDVEVMYSDMTTMPLKYLSPADYFLEVETEDLTVIGVAVTDGPAYLPQVVAKGEGRGELLKVSLKVGESCSRKKSKPIIANTMYIDVDFSQERRVYNDNPYQMDAHYDTNRASDRWDDGEHKRPVYSIKTQSENDEYYDDKFRNDKLENDDELDLEMVRNALGELVEREPEARQEPLRTKTVTDDLTPLEIGMYVLLAVFCVAITVFLVNFVVFFVRYKRKQKPRKAGSTEAIKDANDWVWIGRATLERNSVYTHSSRTLMPEEDFNGNVNHNRNERPLSVGSSSSSGSSSQGSTSEGSSLCNSNRNSVVSTYKGSECSIRITANPLMEEGAMGGVPEETQSELGIPQGDYEAMGMTYDELLMYFDNLKESNA
ncbi:T132B-like protein, partial [Mya arenaria]